MLQVLPIGHRVSFAGSARKEAILLAVKADDLDLLKALARNNEDLLEKFNDSGKERSGGHGHSRETSYKEKNSDLLHIALKNNAYNVAEYLVKTKNFPVTNAVSRSEETTETYMDTIGNMADDVRHYSDTYTYTPLERELDKHKPNADFITLLIKHGAILKNTIRQNLDTLKSLIDSKLLSKKNDPAFIDLLAKKGEENGRTDPVMVSMLEELKIVPSD